MLAKLAEVPTIVWIIVIGAIFMFMLLRSMARMAAENPELLNPSMPNFRSEFGGPDFSGLSFQDVQRADALNTRGIHLAGQGLLSESEQAFREAIRLAPRLANYHVSLSNVLLMQNRVTEAERELLRVMLP